MKIEHKPKDLHEFSPLLVEIEDRPLNPLGRSILWIIISIIVFGSLWLFVGKVDVVVSARGKIVPSGEIKILQPIETGVISKILVREGDSVKKGDILMQIDPTVTTTSLKEKKKNYAVIKLEVQRLRALVYEKNFTPQENEFLEFSNEQLSLYTHQKAALNQNRQTYLNKKGQVEAQIKSANYEIHRLNALLQSDRAQKNRMKEVVDIVAKNDYEKLLMSIKNYQDQLSIAYQKVQELTNKLTELRKQQNAFEEELFSKWHMELSTKQKEQRELASQINAIHFQNKKQQIVAPLDGYIGKLLVHTEGGVVTPAQKLVSIIPQNTPLVINATVLNKDVGFIKKDMDTAIKIDTFSFQKYGLLDGKIINVGNDAIENEKLGLVYEIKVKPLQTTLLVEGEDKKIEPGMSVVVEIKVGKRRIIEFFIYPLIKYLDEGMSVR